MADIYEILKGTNLGTLLHFSFDLAMDGVCAHTCVSPFEMPRCDTLGARVLIDTPTQHGVKDPIFVLSCAVLRPEYHSISFTKLHTLYMYIRGGDVPITFGAVYLQRTDVFFLS